MTTARARTHAELDRHGTPSHEVYTAGFYATGPGAADWDFVVRSLLGKSCRGGADAGEVLATVAAIEPDDRDAWFAGWTTLGTRLSAVAAACAARGHRVSAARSFLRAAGYFAAAVNAITGADGTADPLPTFRAHRAAWEGFVATTAWPVERVDIPYGSTSMPGWLFRPDASGTARATLVVNNGSDGSPAGLWCQCAEGGLERGYNVLLFDGPGQQTMLVERDVPFRYDWEKVLTPVVEFLLARDDVEAGKLAVYGVGQAGYWVTRALAFENRFAAAITDGGVLDVGRSWFAHPPPARCAPDDQGATTTVGELVATRAQPHGGEAGRTWQLRARAHGVSEYSAVLHAVSQYTVAAVARHITTPLYITDPDGEQFFAGQSAELAALVPGATLARFTQDEGASHHGQPMGRELTEQRMFDWLDDRLHRRG